MDNLINEAQEATAHDNEQQQALTVQMYVGTNHELTTPSSRHQEHASPSAQQAPDQANTRWKSDDTIDAITAELVTGQIAHLMHASIRRASEHRQDLIGMACRQGHAMTCAHEQ